MTTVPNRISMRAGEGAFRRYYVGTLRWMLNRRRPIILTISTLIGLTFLTISAWTVSTALGELVAGICVLLAGWYYETNSRPEDR